MQFEPGTYQRASQYQCPPKGAEPAPPRPNPVRGEHEEPDDSGLAGRLHQIPPLGRGKVWQGQALNCLRQRASCGRHGAIFRAGPRRRPLAPAAGVLGFLGLCLPLGLHLLKRQQGSPCCTICAHCQHGCIEPTPAVQHLACVPWSRSGAQAQRGASPLPAQRSSSAVSSRRALAGGISVVQAWPRRWGQRLHPPMR